MAWDYGQAIFFNLFGQLLALTHVQPLHLTFTAEVFFFPSCFKCVEAASPDSTEIVWNSKTRIILSVAVGFSPVKGDI